MDAKEVQANPAKEHKEKKKTHKHNKHHKQSKRHHHRHKGHTISANYVPSKEPLPQKTKKRRCICCAGKASHAKDKEKVGEKNLSARGKGDKILRERQHKAKRAADEAKAQPPQGTTAANVEIEPVGSKHEKKKKKTTRCEQELKGSLSLAPQENAMVMPQDTKKRTAHVKEGHKHKKGRHRKHSKVAQKSAVPLAAMDKKSSQQPDAAALPGQQIASAQAYGDRPALDAMSKKSSQQPDAAALPGQQIASAQAYGDRLALDAMDKKSSQQPDAAAPPVQQIASAQAYGDRPALDDMNKKSSQQPDAAALPGQQIASAEAYSDRPALDVMDKKSSEQPDAAAPPGQQIASAEAYGDRPAREPTVPTTTRLPPATVVGRNVETNVDRTPSTITSVSQASKTSSGETSTLPWERIDKETETMYAQGAQKARLDENKGAGDGKSSQSLGANEMQPRKSDGIDEGERRRKEADKVAMVDRKQSVMTRANDEEDVTLAIRKSPAISKRPVSQVKKVREFVRSISNDGLEGMRKSFIRCKLYLPNAATRTCFDQNQDRVRYRDVICIDQTRVVLKCQPDGSDFIHANRIPIGDSPNQLIVTQVPLANTVQHFWEMVWQEKAEAVLLLLTMEEWKAHVEQLGLIPSKLQCLHLKNMTITVASEMQVEKNWTVLELGLTKDGRSRRIVWHHYSGWKESKGGADIQAIWKIHSSLRKLRRPLICMSMAGAGRAGTYAVLEWAHAMHHDKYRPTVSVEDCVRKVREYRMHSVQSLAQYQYVYMLLLRHIFLVKKIRDDYLSDPAMQKDLENCIEVEQQYFRENTKDGDEEPEITLRCC